MLVSQSQQIPGLCSALWYKKKKIGLSHVLMYTFVHTLLGEVSISSAGLATLISNPPKKRES